jgi:hypothetical protein
VLRPGGILRVVVPDLENVAREYLRLLDECVETPSSRAYENYEWILLEMFDQSIRYKAGGDMLEFLCRDDLVDESYVSQRVGHAARSVREGVYRKRSGKSPSSLVSTLSEAMKKHGARRVLSHAAKRMFSLFSTRASRVGKFRLGGEVHFSVYDRFSLERILCEAGFYEIELMSPHRSSIPEWSRFELDVKDSQIFEPNSLFVEARKPIL